MSQTWGTNGDITAPGDYDGNGRADISVWRDSMAIFYSLNSSNGNFHTLSYGQTGDVPVCGDYDDGKANYALKHCNQWLAGQSTNSQTQAIT